MSRLPSIVLAFRNWFSYAMEGNIAADTQVDTDRFSAAGEVVSGLDSGVAIMDMAIFFDFIQGRPVDRVVMSLSIFVTELTQKAGSLASIIPRQDVHALRMLAHSAVGSASMVGAARLVAQSRSIEGTCMSKEAFDWSEAEGLARTIEETIAALQVLVTEEALDGLRAKFIEAA